jgi:hypothetical protein
VRRQLVAAVVLIIGLLLLADLLVVNGSLAELADLVVAAAILVAAGAALAGVGALGLRRAGDLWRRRGDAVGAALVLVGIAVVLVAGLAPGREGASDPAVGWLLSALVIPIGATLFGLLFVTTLLAARRSVAGRSREAVVLVGTATVTLLLLLPLGGTVGDRLAEASGWALAVPIGAVFRGFLIGIAVVAAVMAARAMLGLGAADE